MPPSSPNRNRASSSPSTKRHAAALTALAAEMDVPFDIIGLVGGDRLLLEVDGDLLIDMPLADAIEAYTTPIPIAMG